MMRTSRRECPETGVADRAERNAEGRFGAWFSRDASPLESGVTWFASG